MEFHRNDWQERLFKGHCLPAGYRVVINPLSIEVREQPELHVRNRPLMPTLTPGTRQPRHLLSSPISAEHLCGGISQYGGVCPNCSQLLFPVFRFTLSDSRIRELTHWDEPWLTILLCPACLLHTLPYWIIFDNELLIMGGMRDGERFREVQVPYDERPVSLVSLEPLDYATDPQTASELNNRWRWPGIYHQIGGIPRAGFDEMTCIKCKSLMEFGGIIDYDDANIPLFEEGQPAALVIGDLDSLHFFLCASCRVVGVKLVE